MAGSPNPRGVFSGSFYSGGGRCQQNCQQFSSSELSRVVIELVPSTRKLPLTLKRGVSKSLGKQRMNWSIPTLASNVKVRAFGG
jgi:hypothetical protein